MKKSLGIDDQDSRFSLYNLCHKSGIQQLEQESSNVQNANKKEKKLSERKQIVIKMNYQIFQNITAQEQPYFEKMTKEFQVIEDIKVYYFEVIVDLIFQ